MGQRNFKPKHRSTSTSHRSFNGRKKIDEMYDHYWETVYTKKFLELNPECYACGAKSQVVDHLKPHQGDEVLFKKTDNHIPLCTTCHNTVTAKFDAKYRSGNPITDKIKWLNKKRVPGAGWNPRRVKVLPNY